MSSPKVLNPLTVHDDELVDLVDNEDKVIGQQYKSVCHQQGLRHRSAAIFIFRDSSYQELLLQRRSRLKTVNPGLLCAPGGHVKAGDSYLETALRELQEECFYGRKIPAGLELKELFKIQKYSDNDREWCTVYRAACAGSFSPNPLEVEGLFFERVEALPQKLKLYAEHYAGTFKELFEEYCKRYR